jgi:predicted Zn-dependent protease
MRLLLSRRWKIPKLGRYPGALWTTVLTLTCTAAEVLPAWNNASATATQADTQSEIRLHYQRAQDELKAGQPVAAAREFREILKLDPNSAEAYANLGEIDLQHGNVTEAVHSFEVALKLQPSLWNAQAFLGLAKNRLGETGAALPLLENSFQHVEDPTLRTEAGMCLVSIYQDSDALEKAAGVLQTLRQSNADDPMVLYAAYRTYSDLAAQAVAELLKNSPDSSAMHLVKAQAYLADNDFLGAIAEDRKALESDPNLPRIHYEMGRALLASSKDETARQEAQPEFEYELKLNPNDAYSEYELGEIFWERSEYQFAIDHFSRACRLRPNLVDAFIGLGKALTASDKAQEALKPLLEAVRLDGDNEVAHFRLAQAYHKLGRNRDSVLEEKQFEKLREARKASSLGQEQFGFKTPTSQTIEKDTAQ